MISKSIKLSSRLTVLGLTKMTAMLLFLPRSAAGKLDEWPFGCHKREFNITHKVQNPENAAQVCEANLSTWACYGSCPTYEYDTPNGVVGQQSVCGFGKYIEKTHVLECPGVMDEAALTVTYHEAVSCECDKCNDNTNTKCLNRKRKMVKENRKRGSIGEYHYPSTKRSSAFDENGGGRWGAFEKEKRGQSLVKETTSLHREDIYPIDYTFRLRQDRRKLPF